MKRLLASIHDVSPRFESEVDALADRLTRLLGAERFAMLVVPDHWNTAPIVPGSPFAGRLRAWADAGIEMFVHGWSHLDDCTHAGGNAWRARHMTAGEGEFLGLSHGEAVARMARGKALVEDTIGRPATGFIAPAWLYSNGALTALADVDFAVAESHMRVWVPRDGRVLTKGPVITWASRTPMRTASSLAAAAILRHALKLAPDVRAAVHPGDTTKPALLASIDRTISSLARGRAVSRYADLAA